MSERVIVAIDGPSGVGKSTTSRRVAAELGIPHIDTGAMYRAVALEALRRNAALDDEDEVASIASEAEIGFRFIDSVLHVYLDGKDGSGEIRTSEVGMAASRISALPPVRRILVDLQRAIGAKNGGVLEGRDIGTKVFPDTPYKFFLTAGPEVRAERRWKDLVERGAEESYASVLASLQKRDDQDSTRADSPLRWDESYTVIDTSEMSIDQVVERIVLSVREKIAQAHHP